MPERLRGAGGRHRARWWAPGTVKEWAMFIQTEQTPNPATLKFLPGREVMGRGVADFTDAEAAEASPLARSLFTVEGVTGVFLGADFITVTKAEGQDWYLLKPAVLGAIMEHYLSGDPVVAPDADLAQEDGSSEEDDAIVRQIRELIDTRVRPAVAQDGGDIIFHGFDKGVVYLHMRGACSGCPSSTITLKNGIENLLRYYVPEVVEVRPVA
jgi:Fe-S cluster biogenesis protein NfuA